MSEVSNDDKLEKRFGCNPVPQSESWGAGTLLDAELGKRRDWPPQLSLPLKLQGWGEGGQGTKAWGRRSSSAVGKPDLQKLGAWLLSQGPPGVLRELGFPYPYQEGLGLAGKADWRSPGTNRVASSAGDSSKSSEAGVDRQHCLSPAWVASWGPTSARCDSI